MHIIIQEIIEKYLEITMKMHTQIIIRIDKILRKNV